MTEQNSSKISASVLRPFVPSWLREKLGELKGAPLSVYLAYLSHANAEGLAWPSLGSLAKTTGYSLNTVKKARRDLVRMGLISAVEQQRTGGEFGKKVFEVLIVGPKMAYGTAAHSTVAPSTVGQKVCQEGSPAQGSPVKGNPVDAVRRRVDAERHVASCKSFSPSQRRKRLEKRIANKLMEGGSTINRDLHDDELKAFAFIGYQPEYPSNLPGGFVLEVVDAYEDHKDDGLARGNLCSKIIDRCMAEQESYKTLGMDPSEYFWPPDFQEHRDRLRAQERAAEAAGGRK